MSAAAFRRAWTWPLTPALVALVCAALDVALIHATWTRAFAGPVEVPAATDVPRSLALLGIAGGITIAMSASAIHRAVARFRRWAAIGTVVALVPALLVGVATFYGWLLLAGWI